MHKPFSSKSWLAGFPLYLFSTAPCLLHSGHVETLHIPKHSPTKYFCTDLDVFNKAEDIINNYSVSQKIPHEDLWPFFQNGCEFFNQMLHVYYAFLSTLDYEYLLKWCFLKCHFKKTVKSRIFLFKKRKIRILELSTMVYTVRRHFL